MASSGWKGGNTASGKVGFLFLRQGRSVAFFFFFISKSMPGTCFFFVVFFFFKLYGKSACLCVWSLCDECRGM